MIFTTLRNCDFAVFRPGIGCLGRRVRGQEPPFLVVAEQGFDSHGIEPVSRYTPLGVKCLFSEAEMSVLVQNPSFGSGKISP